MGARAQGSLAALYTKGLIYGFVFTFSVIVLYGFCLVHKPVLSYIFGVVGFDNEGFLKYVNLAILPIIYSALLALGLRRRSWIQGFLKFLLLGWLFNIILFTLAVIISSARGDEYLSVEGVRLYLTLLFVNPIPLVIEAVLPKTAILIDVYDTVTGASRRAREEVALSGDEVLRIRIIGDSSKISFKSEPDGSVRFSKMYKTNLYSYVDATPLSATKISVGVYYEDRLVRNVKISVKNVNYRNVSFYIYLNEDFIGSSEISVETNKQLIDAVQPVLSGFLSRIGISSSDISEVQFYTKEKVYIPPSAKLIDLPEINEFVVKVYVVDKVGEFLKYLKKSDVYELWEVLVKRLEVLRNRIPNLLKNIEELKRDLDNVVSNWW